MFDTERHNIQIEISRLNEKRRVYENADCELKEFGLEGMGFYVDTQEYEYMTDKDNRYFDIFKKYYSKGW